MNKDKKDVLGGVFWKFSERMFSQIVSAIVAVVLARMLEPSEYGIVAIVSVFTTIANVFVTSGFATSLIQKQDADDIDFSTVFYFTLVFSVAVYIVLYYMAIPISNFYDIPLLKQVLRVLALNIPIMGINSIQQAYVSRKMVFKKFFYATLSGTISSGFIGIIMAYRGFGVWALVTQTLVNGVIGTITLQVCIDWKPITVFSVKRLRTLFGYGWKLLVQSLVLNFYSSLRSLIIGKVYTAEDLAYYTKGIQYPDLICSNIDTALNSALFPAMSREQSSLVRVKAMARRTTQISSYIMNPILIGFIVVAEPFITILLTDKWLPAATFLRIICIVLLFRAPQTAILQAIKAVGRSDIVLKVDIPIRIFALVVLLGSVRFGVIYIALSEVAVTLYGTYMYAMVSKKILDYNLLEVCSDFLYNTLLAIFMGGITFFVGKLIFINIYLRLIVQIVVGVLSYVLLSVITKNESFYYIINMVKEILHYKDMKKEV